MSDFAKGDGAKDASYAKGGGQLGRTRDFIKESDGKDQRVGGFQVYKNPNLDDENYGKSGKGNPDTKRTGDKCLPTVKPRK